MRIAIQGATGSFHHIAAEHYFEGEHDYVYADTFAAVFVALKAGAADVAVIAIENSLYGSIPEVYNLLQKYEFPIIGEVDERITQNLITFHSVQPKDIKRIYSHPVAIAQCAHFLDSHFPEAEIIEHHDTAAAVEHIKRLGDHSNAAIAGTLAAGIHGMSVLQSDIQDEPLNFTRFLVIQPGGTPPEGANKASIILRTSHQPGALYHALGVFNEAGSNLTKLRSRPIPGELWQYQFYVDLEITPEKFAEVTRTLKTQDCDVINLGLYKAAETVYED